MKLNIQALNPLNKQKDQKRDNDGKFTAGSGGLSKLKKFNWARSAPIIVVIALVGGFLVFRSFAGQTLYKYQHSAYLCPGFNASDLAKNTSDSCVGSSAEALTYRYYQGIFGRTPVAKGYKYWVQQFAGDRTKVSRGAEIMLASREASYDKLSTQDYVSAVYKNVLGRNADQSGQKYWTTQLDTKKKTRAEVLNYFAARAKITPTLAAQKMGRPTNEEFVKQAYVGLMGRQADSKGLAYWKSQLDTKKIAPKDVIASFAISNESIKKHAPAVAEYLKTATKVNVVQTAQKRQDANLYSAASKANEARDQYSQISGLVSAGRKVRDVASGQAAKNPPTRSHLTAIAENQKTVQGYKARVPGPAKKIATISRQIAPYCTSAASIAAYSPDISDVKVKEQCNKVTVYKTIAASVSKDLDALIGQIAASYKTAEGKYETEQNRIAAEQAAAQQTDGNGGVNPGETSLDVVPPPDDTTGQDFLNYMNKACAKKTGTARFSIDNGYVYRQAYYKYSGNGTKCSIARYGVYIEGAVFCRAGYAPAPGFRCKKTSTPTPAKHCKTGYFYRTSDRRCWTSANYGQYPFCSAQGAVKYFTENGDGRCKKFYQP